jgi:hypothetical protein
VQCDLLLWIKFFLNEVVIFFEVYFIISFLLSGAIFGRSSGASTLLLLFPDTSPNMLKVTHAEGSDVSILSIPASATPDLLYRVFAQLSFLAPAHGFLNGGKDHSLNVKVEAHANGVCSYQEFDVAQAIVKHVSLRLLCVRWEGAINYGTVIRILSRSLPLVKTLVNSVLYLE